MLEIKKVSIDSIFEDPTNVRKHGTKNLSAIKSSIAKFGQVEPLLVKHDSRIIIGGNGRHRAMKEMGITDVDIIEIDVNNLDATALSIALNRTGELAEWYEDELTETLKSLAEDGFDLSDIGYDDVDLSSLFDNELKKDNYDQNIFDNSDKIENKYFDIKFMIDGESQLQDIEKHFVNCKSLLERGQKLYEMLK